MTLKSVSKKLTSAARNHSGTNLTGEDVQAIVQSGILHVVLQKEADEIQGVIKCLRKKAPSKLANIGSKRKPKAHTGSTHGIQNDTDATNERRQAFKIMNKH